jgi:hypothetical protein
MTLTLTINGQTHRYCYTSPEAMMTWLTWMQRTAHVAAA